MRVFTNSGFEQRVLFTAPRFPESIARFSDMHLRLRDHHDPAIPFALMLIQTIIPILPSVVVMVVAVLAYGPFMGGIVAWTGLLLAAALGYGMGMSLGPVTVDRLVGAMAKRKVERTVDRYGVWAVVAARISPVLSTDAMSIVAGLARMQFWRFLVATALGTLPLAIAVAWLGSSIERLKTGLIWIGGISVAAFVGYVWFDHHHNEHAREGFKMR